MSASSASPPGARPVTEPTAELTLVQLPLTRKDKPTTYKNCTSRLILLICLSSTKKRELEHAVFYPGTSFCWHSDVALHELRSTDGELCLSKTTKAGADTEKLQGQEWHLLEIDSEIDSEIGAHQCTFHLSDLD